MVRRVIKTTLVKEKNCYDICFRLHRDVLRRRPHPFRRGESEYSCRCHGKRVISAPSKPLKLLLAGHIL